MLAFLPHKESTTLSFKSPQTAKKIGLVAALIVAVLALSFVAITAYKTIYSPYIGVINSEAATEAPDTSLEDCSAGTTISWVNQKTGVEKEMDITLVRPKQIFGSSSFVPAESEVMQVEYLIKNPTKQSLIVFIGDIKAKVVQINPKNSDKWSVRFKQEMFDDLEPLDNGEAHEFQADFYLKKTGKKKKLKGSCNLNVQFNRQGTGTPNPTPSPTPAPQTNMTWGTLPNYPSSTGYICANYNIYNGGSFLLGLGGQDSNLSISSLPYILNLNDLSAGWQTGQFPVHKPFKFGARYGMACDSDSQGRVYVSGGIRSDGNTDWQFHTFLPNERDENGTFNWYDRGFSSTNKRAFHGGTIAQNKFVMMGGWSLTYRATDSIYALDIPAVLTNTWTWQIIKSETNDSANWYTLNSVVYNSGKVYSLGGRGNGFSGLAKSSTKILDLSNNSLSDAASMPLANYGMSCAPYQNKIYCIGGNKNPKGSMVYDITSNSWNSSTQVLPQPSQAIIGAGSDYYYPPGGGMCMFFVGGFNYAADFPETPFTNRVQVLSIDGASCPGTF